MSRSRQPSNSCCLSPVASLTTRASLSVFLSSRLALLSGVLFIAACSESDQSPANGPSLCQGDHTAIAEIQGEGFISPMVGETVTTRGIVTRVEPNRGVYLQEPGTATSASMALFVEDAALSGVIQSGQDVTLRGRIAERGGQRDTLTSLVEIAQHQVCAEGAALPLISAGLPLSAHEREALEGMRVEFDGPMFLTDAYELHRGIWTLSTEAPLRLPTEDAPPGRSAADRARRDRQRVLKIALPGSDFPALPVGTRVGPSRGVLGQLDDRQQLLVESTPQLAAQDPDPLPPPAPNHLRIVSLNLLNFFNGDGRGGGFPTARGAQTPEEFARQQRRTQAALEMMQPHLLAVQELENDGFGPLSAAQSMLDLLNAAKADGWAVVRPDADAIGGDIITVGLFYRRDLLQPVGPPELLHGPAFERLSRVPLAQLFRDRASGQEFLVTVNHLKSKGRCPAEGPNTDQGDGQGCWNEARVRAVESLTSWLDGLSTRADTPRVLILGDMNAWRREEPITAFEEAGYTDLVKALRGLPQHSFVYFGQRGTLDYALATPAMQTLARQAVIWHINADWPRKMELPQPWLRMSDHDPVVVDFELSQAVTSD